MRWLCSTRACLRERARVEHSKARPSAFGVRGERFTVSTSNRSGHGAPTRGWSPTHAAGRLRCNQRFDAQLAVQVTQPKQQRARRRQVADHQRATSADGIAGCVNEYVVSGRVHERHARTIDAHERLVRAVDHVVQVGVEGRRGRRVDLPECPTRTPHFPCPFRWGEKAKVRGSVASRSVPPQCTPDRHRGRRRVVRQFGSGVAVAQFETGLRRKPPSVGRLREPVRLPCLIASLPFQLMATCPGALVVHADDTVMSCTEDDERDGCRGRDLRHEGDPVRC